jgi:hypothetical protein
VSSHKATSSPESPSNVSPVPTPSDEKQEYVEKVVLYDKSTRIFFHGLYMLSKASIATVWHADVDVTKVHIAGFSPDTDLTNDRDDALFFQEHFRMNNITFFRSVILSTVM